MPSSKTITPAAEQLLKELLAGSTSQKFHNSIDGVKRACDAIERMGAIMDYSKVAAYATEHFGRPKRQTVMNSTKLKSYIDLRISEYKTKRKELFPIKPHNKSARELDMSGLDPTMRRKVADLQQRCNMLQNILEDLKERAVINTRISPHPTAQAIAVGASPSHGNLQIVQQATSQELPPGLSQQSAEPNHSYPAVASSVLGRLITLLDDADPHHQSATLSWESHRDHRFMQAMLGDGPQTLISPDELEEITQWLECRNGK
ncbi:conserved hypothetical protein [Vibrio chagasii]|nr:conserved hypothetical protein [Vibrio chagasii]CAH7235192.1 conserved hypothetical protein [Vibrio chagasii]